MADDLQPGVRGGAVVRGGLLPYGFAIVRGRSMEPTLRDGDRVLVRHGAPARAGDVVVARFVDGTVAVKRAVERRATRTGEAAWWLLSDNPAEGIDSRHRGPVPDADVVALVRLRVWPRPGALRR